MSRRPIQQWLGLLLLLALIPVVCGRYLLTSASIAEPVRFHVVLKAAAPEDLEDKIQFFAIDQNNNLFKAHKILTITYWIFLENWIHELVLLVPERDLDHLERLEITAGNDELRIFSGDEVRSWVRKPPGPPLREKEDYSHGDVVVSVPNVFGRDSAIPWVNHARNSEEAAGPPWNWPGDGRYLRAIGQASLLPCLIVVMLAWLLVRCGSDEGRALCLKLLTDSTPRGEVLRTPRVLDVGGTRGVRSASPRGVAWNWVGFLFLVSMLTMLEVRQPYHFTQEDNLVESLPMILVGCRSIWQGEFPAYNPYLFMGAPLASLGMYALTYPPLPASYAIARHILGSEYLTLEVFAISHLLIGFFATRLLGIRLGMRIMPANLVALSCVLSGPALIMCRGWFNFTPIFTWLPILLLGVERLRHGLGQKVSWRWILGMGLASGLTFHVGFSQAAIYINGFLWLAVLFLVADGSLPWRRALAMVPAFIIGAGIALPLVYLQWRATEGVKRYDAWTRGIAQGLPATLLPYPVVETALPMPLGNVNVAYLGHLYFFGGLLALLFFFQAVGWLFLRFHRITRPLTKAAGQVWTFCALFTLWLGLGDAGGLWTLVAELPVVGFINRYPMRVLPFFVFFASMSGGLMLERLLRMADRGAGGPPAPTGEPPAPTGEPPAPTGEPPAPTGEPPVPRVSWTRQRTEWMIAVPALGLLVWHVAHCCTAFYTFGFRPYPELPTEMTASFWQDDQPTGRMASWTRYRSSDPNFALLLPLDVPAVYRLPSWDGYNPLLDGTRAMRDVQDRMEIDPARTLRAYGIRWNFFHDPNRLPTLTTAYSVMWKLEAADKMRYLRKLPPEQLAEIYHKDGVIVRERAKVDALAFAVDDPERCLPLTFRGGGLDVALPSPEKETKVVLNFLYLPDMKAFVDGQETVCQPDEWNRISVDVSSGSQLLEVRYRPPWGKGLLLGLMVVIFGLIVAASLRRKRGE